MKKDAMEDPQLLIGKNILMREGRRKYTVCRVDSYNETNGKITVTNTINNKSRVTRLCNEVWELENSGRANEMMQQTSDLKQMAVAASIDKKKVTFFCFICLTFLIENSFLLIWSNVTYICVI